MKRMTILILSVLLLLSSCATRTPRPQALPFTVQSDGQQTEFILSIGKEELLQSGYRQGDWLDLTFDGVILRVLFAAGPKYKLPTLVASERQSSIHLPMAIAAGQKGVLHIAKPEAGGKTSLHLSGSFVFTF